ncbi:hypothetical protein NUK49_20600, partial [Aeromonas caviae]|uniref:hypothetical protein n=1 Tax=Aeromonas caviae TaxID=648 RepID=UPI00214E1952
MKLLALAMSSIFVAGLAEGAIKYKCDGEWVDYWPCDKEQVEHHVQDLKKTLHLKFLLRSCSVSIFAAWF